MHLGGISGSSNVNPTHNISRDSNDDGYISLFMHACEELGAAKEARNRGDIAGFNEHLRKAKDLAMAASKLEKSPERNLQLAALFKEIDSLER